MAAACSIAKARPAWSPWPGTIVPVTIRNFGGLVEIVRAFDSDDIVLVDRVPDIRARRLNLTSIARHGYERRLDMPLVRGSSLTAAS
jgi:hypothetical protein